MLIIQSSTTTIYPVAVAAEVAASNNADDDSWTYVVEVNPKDATKAIVKIFDEDGGYLGTL